MNIFERIRSHSREEWELHFTKKVKDVRIWIQEHPEKAALCALVIGMAMVLFYRLVFVIFTFVFLILGGIWVIALPESQREKSGN